MQPIDFMIDIYMLLFDKYVITPIEPLQRDLGVDGNGANYQTDFKNAMELKQRCLTEQENFEFFIKRPIIENSEELKLHDQNMNLSLISKMKILLKYVLKRIFK